MATAEVHRCIRADGTLVFTDRSCADVGAVAPTPVPAGGMHVQPSRTMCMRSVHDLVFEMSMAFDARDANRLAGLYDWTGMSSNRGYDVIERLDRMVERPLVDIVPVFPEPPAPMHAPVAALPAAPPDAEVVTRLPAAPATSRRSYVARLTDRMGMPQGDEGATEEADATTGEPPRAGTPMPPMPPVASEAATDTAPAPYRPPRPTGIRVVQTLSNGTTPSTTVFGLRRHFGCWWIRD